MKSLPDQPSYIEFTVDSPATLIVVASSTGVNNKSYFVLKDADGNLIDSWNGNTAATGADGTTFLYTIEKAGTYRFECTSLDRVGRLMSMRIAENHKYTIEETTKEATCTETGIKTLYCECGKTKTEEIPALGHNYVDGRCSVCNVVNPATCKHTNETSDVTAPTCTESGYTTYICDDCGNVRKADETAALGHNFVNGVCNRTECEAVEPSANDFVINFSTWDEFAKGKYVDGDTVKYNDIFTFIYSGNSKVDSSSKKWDDFSGTLRFSFGGKTNDGVPTKNALKITVDGSYTIQIWYVAGGNGRYFELRDSNGTAISTTTDETKQNVQYYSELVIPEAGTYYLTVPADNQYIFQIELVENSGN